MCKVNKQPKYVKKNRDEIIEFINRNMDRLQLIGQFF